MTNNLVERLRVPTRFEDVDELRNEAADYIENADNQAELLATRLELCMKRRNDQNDRIMALEAALRDIDQYEQIDRYHDGELFYCKRRARRALEGES